MLFYYFSFFFLLALHVCRIVHSGISPERIQLSDLVTTVWRNSSALKLLHAAGFYYLLIYFCICLVACLIGHFHTQHAFIVLLFICSNFFQVTSVF